VIITLTLNSPYGLNFLVDAGPMALVLWGLWIYRLTVSGRNRKFQNMPISIYLPELTIWIRTRMRNLLDAELIDSRWVLERSKAPKFSEVRGSPWLENWSRIQEVTRLFYALMRCAKLRVKCQRW